MYTCVWLFLIKYSTGPSYLFLLIWSVYVLAKWWGQARVISYLYHTELDKRVLYLTQLSIKLQLVAGERGIMGIRQRSHNGAPSFFSWNNCSLIRCTHHVSEPALVSHWKGSWGSIRCTKPCFPVAPYGHTKIHSLLLFLFVDVSVRRPCSSYAEYIPQLILFPSSFIYNSSSLVHQNK